MFNIEDTFTIISNFYKYKKKSKILGGGIGFHR